MRISQDLREEARQAGLAEKAAEFRRGGSEIYLPRQG
jgi:hypothetical protein